MNIIKKAHLTGHQGSIYTMAYPYQGDFLLSSGGDGWIVKWDIHNPDLGQLIAKVEDDKIFSLLSIPQSSELIAGNMNGGIHFIDTINSDKNKNIAHHKKGVFDILFIQNHIYTLGGEGVITRWGVSPFHALESLHLSSKSLRAATYHPQRNEIAIGASDGNIYIIDTALNYKKHISDAHNNSVFSIQYIPNSSFLMSGGRDAVLKIWDLSQELPTLVHEIQAHNYTINDIQFNPHTPSVLATGSRDKTIKIWHINSLIPFDMQLLKVINTVKNGSHINSINKLCWLNPTHIASASDDKTIMIWEVSSNTSG